MKKRSFTAILMAMAMLLLPAVALAGGTECPNGSACTEHAAAIDSVHYDTLSEAIADAQSGQTITLLRDVQESSVTFNKSGTYTLDLNTFELSTVQTGSDIIAIKAGDLNLEIKNGKLTSTAANTYGIYAYGTYQNLNLVLNGVVLKSADQSLGVQGLNTNQNVTVKDSEIVCGNTAVYFPPKSGTLRIENSKIQAVDNGIVIKGGALEIVGEKTHIVATGTPEDQDKPYDGNTQGEGFPKSGNAIYAEGGYKNAAGTGERPIDISIQDGTFESENAAAVAMNFLKDTTVQKMEITGGEFTSDVMQFVAPAAVAASVTTATNETRYYIGTSDSVAQEIAAAAKAGDTVAAKQGDLTLNGLANGVTVQNDGTGDVFVNGEQVGDTPIVSHTHSWKVSWTWKADNSGATANFVCQDDASHTKSMEATVEKKTTPATCTEDGSEVYTASVTLDGKVYSDTKTVTLKATGHSYENGVCTVCGEKEPNADIPQTGDAIHPALWAALAAAFGGAALIASRKRVHG